MRRGTRFGNGTRPHWALLACGLWLLGFDVVPLAHLVFHDSLDHHDHGHHHAGDHDHEGQDETPAEHGDGSVAHRDLAAQIPSPSIPAVQEALLAATPTLIRAHDERPTDRQPQTTKARGPPAQTT